MNSASISQADATTRAPVANFNSLARVYRWLELFTFGPWLQRCRVTFLPDLAARRNALVLGDGDGRFTSELLNSNQELQLDAVDLSFDMLLALLCNAGRNVARVQTYCADARTWALANPPYDLVTTHFFLDCLTNEEVGDLVNRLRSNLAPDALWVVSEFSVPKGWFGRLVAGPVVSLLYLAFGFFTGLTIRSLPDHATALRVAGFTLNQSRRWLGGLLVSELWSAGPEPAIENELREF